MERRDNWTFYQDSHSNWRWRRSTFGGKIIAYSQPFSKVEDCVANAKFSGYKAS